MNGLETTVLENEKPDKVARRIDERAKYVRRALGVCCRDQFVGLEEARPNAGRRQRCGQGCAFLERNREVGIRHIGNGIAGILLKEDRGDESPKFRQLFRCRARCWFENSREGEKLRQDWIHRDPFAVVSGGAAR